MGIGMLVAVASALALLRSPVAAGVLLAGAMPVIAGFKRGLLVPGFRLSELAAVGVGLLILAPLEVRRAARWRTFDWLALAYAVGTASLGWFDIVTRGASLSKTGLGTLFGPFQYFIMYRAITSVLRSADHQRRALRLVIFLSPIVSLSAIAQQLNVPGVRSLLLTLTGADLYGANPQEGGQPLTIPPRASGVFPFWHETGGYLMIIVLLVVGLLLNETQRTSARRWLIAILLLDAAALVETATIAPIIGAAVGVAVLGVWYGRSKTVVTYMLVMAAILGAAYFPLLQARSSQQFSSTPGITASSSPLVPETIAYRLVIFKTQDIPLLRGRWLTGYGPSLPSSYSFGFTESLYFTMLLRGGLILLAIYLALMWALFTRARTAARHAASAEQLAVARVMIIVVGLLVFIHFIEGYFVDTGPADLIWVLAALLTCPPRGEMRARRRRRPKRVHTIHHTSLRGTAP